MAIHTGISPVATGGSSFYTDPLRDKSLIEIALDTLQGTVELTASTVNDLSQRLSPVLRSRDDDEKAGIGGPRSVAACKLEERIIDIQADVARLHLVVARLRDTLCI